METGESPKLSIVIASDNASHTIEDCLNALKRQAHGKAIETIVVDCSTDETPRIVKTRYPDSKLFSFSRRMTLPFLLDIGIKNSTGDIITLTDATCIADPNWISEILKAHVASYPVIGGAVEIEGRKGMVDWAAYFCDYAQFMCPLIEGVTDELPGNNISFKRWVLQKGGEFVENGFWKTYWCRKLQEKGIQLVLRPSIMVYSRKSYLFIPFLIRRFHHGRCFAGMRMKGVSNLIRVYYISGSPFLPLLFLGRVIRTTLSKRRHMKEFALSLPVTVLAIVCWSIGEFWGYLAGPGDSCNRIYIY